VNGSAVNTSLNNSILYPWNLSGSLNASSCILYWNGTSFTLY
jgi:hypothetical protein